MRYSYNDTIEDIEAQYAEDLEMEAVADAMEEWSVLKYFTAMERTTDAIMNLLDSKETV